MSDWDEETLDPENWDELTILGHEMLDDMMGFMKNIRTQPFKWPTESAINEVMVPMRNEGEKEEEMYNFFKNTIIPYTGLCIKPQFWGFVLGTGSPFGMLTEMLMSGVNYFDEFLLISKYTYKQALDWVKELLDIPQETGGVFVGSGSEANFTGLAVARNAKAEVDMKGKGMQGVDRYMTLYCSDQTHDCLDRSIELLGLGNEALRWIPTDENYQINIEKLEKAIKDDRSKGYNPFCIIGNAGTVHTGAFDDFNKLANLAKKENMWFHIDGAFGAWVKLSDSHKHLTDGLERADSLAVDFHKWMNMPYTCACTLVKDRRAHYSTFVYGHEAEYLKSAMAMNEDQYENRGMLSLPLSRPAYGVKAYMLLRTFGKNKYRRLIQKNINQAQYLSELMKKGQNIELTAPVSSNIVCFRYISDGLSEDELEKLNRLILGDMWNINMAMISDTTIKGKYSLRVCNVNHRTRKYDFDWLVEEIKKSGEKQLQNIRDL
jgi:glutamate/tyrosine decarboxylase-like PLP-dependent enzyme